MLCRVSVPVLFAAVMFEALESLSLTSQHLLCLAYTAGNIPKSYLLL